MGNDDRSLEDSLAKPAPAIAGPLDGAFGQLDAIRTEARKTSNHEAREALVRRAWDVAWPVYEVLQGADDPLAPGLMAKLDRALRDTVSDPFAGPPVLLQEQPQADSGPQAGGAVACCITWIQLRNIMKVPARVTAVGTLGMHASRVLQPGESRTLSKRENAAPDDEGADAKGPMIPGGLEHCVTIHVEIQNELGQWVEIMSREVCCDKNRPGDILDPTPPPPAPTDKTITRPMPVLQIVDWLVASPCPIGHAQLSPDDQVGSDPKTFDGLDVPGKGHFIGGSVSLLYVAPGCKHFCFIQAVKRSITVDNVVNKAFSHDWRLDLLPDQPRNPPCYKYQHARPEGGTILTDSPGLLNPWAPASCPTGRSSGSGQGSTCMGCGSSGRSPFVSRRRRSSGSSPGLCTSTS
jgi:hypothetical protein